MSGIRAASTVCLISGTILEAQVLGRVVQSQCPYCPHQLCERGDERQTPPGATALRIVTGLSRSPDASTP
jgi:hypothetical protein